MFFEKELRFLCSVFKNSHIHANFVLREDLSDLSSDIMPDVMTGKVFHDEKFFDNFLLSLKPVTVYRLTDFLERSYLFLLLPDTDGETLLYIGPFLQAPMSEQRLLKIGEENNISPQKQKYVNEYYSTLPVLSSDSPLMTVFNTFCETIWKSPSFDIINVTEKGIQEKTFATLISAGESGDNVVNMKAIENRYGFENKIINAVTLGQLHMEEKLRTAFSPEFFEQRVQDPIRNAKNYAIIMNTLLRKAAEKGGVHPFYIDKMSSDFAVRIESLKQLSEFTSFMVEIFTSYCTLVRNFSVSGYSKLVQKVILQIDADISSDLSPASLSRSFGVSLGHLSSVFRKETGKRLTEFIRKKRIDHACELLLSTDLQVQTIALHCGMLDVQYFSKVFKKVTGLTPTEYRQKREK